MIIKEVFAKKIFDSRKEPTIEVSVNGQKASSPSGKSKGKYETPSYHKSLDWNIKAINSFAELKGLNVNSFADLHIIEDLIKEKFKLKDAKQFGANSLFALESAILKSIAKQEHKELWQVINSNAKKIPVPLGNVIGGGLHSHNKDHPIFQEFLLAPKGKNMAKNFNIMKKVYHELGKLVKSSSINDEGAWQTSLDEKKVLDRLKIFSRVVNIGIDIAASSFYKNNLYRYKKDKLNKEEQINYINDLIEKYNLLYAEDPLNEKDFSGFSKISKKCLVVGDDLTVTHIDRLQKAIKNKSINAMIIKPNQNGSLIEVKKIFEICKKNRIKTILSHRSGETLDSAIADYAFAFGADFIKCGIATPYREIKLKRLIEIEKGL